MTFQFHYIWFSAVLCENFPDLIASKKKSTFVLNIKDANLIILLILSFFCSMKVRGVGTILMISMFFLYLRTS